MDYYLRANDEQHLWQALSAAGLTVETEEGPRAQGIDLDIIGVIYRETGAMITANSPDQGEFTYPETEPIPGFHANLRGDLSEEQIALLPLIDKPTTPVRIWFGD